MLGNFGKGLKLNDILVLNYDVRRIPNDFYRVPEIFQVYEFGRIQEIKVY